MCSSTKEVSIYVQAAVDEIMTYTIGRAYTVVEFFVRLINEGGKTRKVPRQMSTASYPIYSNEAVDTLAITLISESIPCWRGTKNGSMVALATRWWCLLDCRRP